MRHVLAIAIVISGPSWITAQMIINSVAGGKIRSGVAAQQVVVGDVKSMAFDPQGNLVFAEATRNVIRRIRLDGIIETIAGTGISGFSGDGGPATSALLNNPTFLQFDSAGNLYFADAANFRIRKIDTGGTITTAASAGPALATDLTFLTSLAVDSKGTVFISDTAAHVFAISAGQISLLSAVRGFTLAIDSKDRLYSGNSSSLIRFSSAGGAEDLSTWLKRSGIQHIGAIGVDAADNVYVASGVQNAVHAYPFYQFTPSGVSHPLQSTFDQVNSIAITAGGNIWLAAGFLMNAQGYFLGQ